MGGCGWRGEWSNRRRAWWSGVGVSGRPETAGKARYNNQVEGTRTLCVIFH